MQNIFISEGNLGGTPTLKYVPVNGGQEQRAVLECDVKFNVQRRDKQTGEYQDEGGFWRRVAVWGKRAEICNDLLVKGCRVIVVGEEAQQTFTGTRREREGQQMTVGTITASFIGLSVLGIDSVEYSQRRSDEPSEHDEDDRIPMD